MKETIDTPVFVGIDISKDHLDVALPDQGEETFLRVNNAPDGFAKLVAQLPAQAHVVVEATGPYYLPLALHLVENEVVLSVVNPLVVKHYARMQLKRAKTDRVDALLLRRFGQQMTPATWQPPKEHVIHLQQLRATLDHYVRERTRIANQREAFSASGRMNKQVKASLRRLGHRLDAEIKRLEKEIQSLIETHHGDLDDRLRSIPGIGPKTAMLLIILTEGFTRFEEVKQLVAYVGLTPRLYESGRRRGGRTSISKMGMSRARACLYMGARSARHHNPACKALYERLRAGGKSHRVALVAVSHKLLRQAFAVGTQGGHYDLNLSMNNNQNS